METEHKSTETRAPKGSLGEVKAQVFKLPVHQVEKLGRIAAQRRLNKTALIRGAIDAMEERDDV